MQIRENISLKELTTLKFGGRPRYFVSVSNVEELAEAISFSREKKLPFVVLGGGSNVLIAGSEFPGLIIKNDIKGLIWRVEGDTVLVTAGAGESWDALVAEAVQRGLWGIENLSGIPGTVGAAPIQNIGAYGMELKDVLEKVAVFDAAFGNVRVFSKAECRFGYRESIFKHKKGGLIVVSVTLQLHENGTPNLGYQDLMNRFAGRKTPTLQEIRDAVLEIRSQKFPDLAQFGTAGSFFKNPVISQKQFNELKALYPGLPGFELKIKDEGLRIKVPLAWLLDNICNLKGFRKGSVALFERQPIVLVQDGNATSEEVEAFAKEVAQAVKQKTGIDIEWEVAFVGDKNQSRT